MEINQEKRLIDSVKFYRSMGFFKSDNSLSDKQLIEKIGNKIKFDTLYRDESNNEYGIPSYFDDIILISCDNDRVWFKDVESDVCDGNNIYVKTLNEWSLISNSKFNPDEVEEKWDKNNICIEFKLKDKMKIIYPKFLYDFIDINIINNINSFIESSGYKFEVSVLDQLVFVCLLNKDEKEKLQKYRKFEFCDI